LVSFEDASIASRCGELHYAFIADRPRGEFTNAALGVCGIVHRKLLAVEHSESARDWTMSEAQERRARRKVAELTKRYGGLAGFPQDFDFGEFQSEIDETP
jgi:hypothetical protein